MDTYRIIVTGGAAYRDEERVYDVLNKFVRDVREPHQSVTIALSDDVEGINKWVRELDSIMGFQVETFSDSAGMIGAGANLVLAFPAHASEQHVPDLIRRAMFAGIRVIEVDPMRRTRGLAEVT